MIKEVGVRQLDSAHGSVLVYAPFLYVNTSNGVDDTHKKLASPDAPSLIVLEKATGRLVARDSPISGTATAANGVLYVATMTHLYADKKTALQIATPPPLSFCR